MADRWRDLIDTFGWFNPRLVKALEHSRAAGMDAEMISGVYFPNREGAYVTFQTPDAKRSFGAQGELI